MNYPITTTDLIEGLATDDEIATLICIEAIISNTFSELEISDETQREQIKAKVQSWSGFGEYSKLISSQKALLNRPLAGAISGDNLNLINEDSLEVADKLAVHTMTKIKSPKENPGRNRSRVTVLSGLAVACTIAFVFIGVSSMISNQSSGTKSSSTRTSAERQKILESYTNQGDQITTNTTNIETSSPNNGAIDSGSLPKPLVTNSTKPTTLTDSTSSDSKNSRNSAVAISIIAVPVFMLAAVAFIYKKRSN